MDVAALRQALSVLLVFSLLGLALWKLRQARMYISPAVAETRRGWTGAGTNGAACPDPAARSAPGASAGD